VKLLSDYLISLKLVHAAKAPFPFSPFVEGALAVVELQYGSLSPYYPASLGNMNLFLEEHERGSCQIMSE
jgi:hypothetical protein